MSNKPGPLRFLQRYKYHREVRRGWVEVRINHQPRWEGGRIGVFEEFSNQTLINTKIIGDHTIVRARLHSQVRVVLRKKGTLPFSMVVNPPVNVTPPAQPDPWY